MSFNGQLTCQNKNDYLYIKLLTLKLLTSPYYFFEQFETKYFCHKMTLRMACITWRPSGKPYYSITKVFFYLAPFQLIRTIKIPWNYLAS